MKTTYQKNNKDIINYKKETIVNTIANLLYLLALWLMTMITPRISDLNNAGVFTICLSVSNICTAISTYSINFYVSSDMDHKYNEKHYLFFGFSSTFISLLVSIIISLSFGYQFNLNLFFAVIFYYIYKCSENVTLVVSANMQRVGKLYLSGYALIVKAIVSLGVFALTLGLSKNIALAFGMLAILGIVYFILVDFRMLKKYTNIDLKINKEEYKKAISLFIVAFPVFLYGIAFAAVVSFPRLILGKYVDAQVLGFFGTMAAISTLIQSALSAILIPYIPKIVELYKKKDFKGLRNLILLFVWFIFLATLLAFACACHLDKWLMGIVCPGDSSKFLVQNYSTFFKWIILGTGIQAFTILANIALIAIRQMIPLIISSSISIVSMFICSYLLIPKYTIKGTIITYVISYGLFFLIAIVVFRYNIGKLKTKKKKVDHEKNLSHSSNI